MTLWFAEWVRGCAAKIGYDKRMATSRDARGRGSVKEYVTRDGPIAGTLLAAALYGAMLAGIAFSYGGKALWMIGSVLCGALLAALVNPPHEIWLEGDVLVSRRGLRRRRLPLRTVRSVRVDWVPRAGDLLVLRRDDVRIGLRGLDEGSADLRRAIGHLVPSAVVDSGRASDLLYRSDTR